MMNPLDRQHVTWGEMEQPSTEQLAAFLAACTAATREDFVAAATSAFSERSDSFVRNLPDVDKAREVLQGAVQQLRGAAYERAVVTERQLGALAEQLDRLLRSLPYERDPAPPAQRMLEGDDGSEGHRGRVYVR